MAIQFQEIKKSTAARKDVRSPAPAGQHTNAVMRKLIEAEPLMPKMGTPVAGTQALHVESIQKSKRGRPKTGFDKLSYNRQFMADKRAASKLGLTVKEYRKRGERK